MSMRWYVVHAYSGYEKKGCAGDSGSSANA